MGPTPETTPGIKENGLASLGERPIQTGTLCITPPGKSIPRTPVATVTHGKPTVYVDGPRRRFCVLTRIGKSATMWRDSY
jgi:hypothetical protein